jgi:hypothetical protein
MHVCSDAVSIPDIDLQAHLDVRTDVTDNAYNNNRYHGCERVHHQFQFLRALLSALTLLDRPCRL